MVDVVRGRVLVTGAGGFLGSHLLPKIPGAMVLVRTRSRWETISRLEGCGEVVPVVGDVQDPSHWSAGLGGVATIVHMAALVRHSRRGADEVYDANVEGTLAMVRLASQLGARLVFVSTSGTVGCFSTPDQEADEGAPYCRETIRRWPYYDSKMKAEIQARELARQLGVELVIVRLPVLLGPGDHVGRSTGLIERIINGRQRFLMKGGIAFTDVRDVATGLMSIMFAATPRAVYHLPGTSFSLNQLFLRCAELSGAKPPRVSLPAPIARLAAHLAARASRVLGFRSLLPDPVVVEMASHYWGFRSRWAHEIGFAARPPDETLRDTIAWLRSTKGREASHAT
jgi:dihydroflavonol-4-reductase